MKFWAGLIVAIGLMALSVGFGSCAAIEKPCPACNTPNNPADYPMPDDNGDNPSTMTKKSSDAGAKGTP